MNKKELFELTPGQKRAFDGFKRFIADNNAKVFILKGYAGTGKTTLMKEFIKEMQSQELQFRLLASTGRAAKILSNTTGHEAKTIHSEIYKFAYLTAELENVAKARENPVNEPLIDSSGQILLNFELTPTSHSPEQNAIFYIIDEASMVADASEKNSSQALFGSGKLLSDLFKYDTAGKFVFVGDVCQLPPIAQNISPALSAQYILDNFDYQCSEFELTEVVRQNDGNDIVHSAHKMRKLYYNPQPWKWAKFPFKGYHDIHIFNSQAQLINAYIQRVKEKGFNYATLLCFSNKQCNLSTRILRPTFGHMTSNLEEGDLLLVTQNNLISGLMNGDLVVVNQLGTHERRAGMDFLKVEVKELFTQKVYQQFLITDILYGAQTNLLPWQHKDLYIDFYYRMKDLGITQHTKEFYKAMLADPYLNALRAVFGYALTCHKAQGGEWEEIYLDIPRNVPALAKPYVYQWVYTAMTRAKKSLYIVDDFWVM